MKRILLEYLQSWLGSPDRKPLVLRGARQVGKTWLVRHLAEKSSKQLIEFNFEKQPNYIQLFDSNDPKQVFLNISTALNLTIDPSNCLLFLDEIQAKPELFATLRWFAEDLPELPIIAAGSLLEFVLADHSFSMPVGRISYMHLEPMCFEEFLLANDQHKLYEYINNYDHRTVNNIPDLIHYKLIDLFKQYILIGGMPAVVANWSKQHVIGPVNQLQMDLLATYRDDFTKYKGKIGIERLDEVINFIPQMLGQKFVYSRINKDVQSGTVKQALSLLNQARVCHRVQACAANGVPLGAEIKHKYFKQVYLDTGLCSAALGLNFNQINKLEDIVMVNNGGIAEQVVGQILRTINPPYIEPSLFYWQRDQAGSSAELDYVIQHGNQVIPIEVKSGATGSLKSLHLFMGLKQYTQAVRINADRPSYTDIDLTNSIGKKTSYNLLSLPFYLTGQLNRLLSDIYI